MLEQGLKCGKCANITKLAFATIGEMCDLDGACVAPESVCHRPADYIAKICDNCKMIDRHIKSTGFEAYCMEHVCGTDFGDSCSRFKLG